MRRRLFYALSIAAAAVPFAFASIRAAQTGQDFRYFWVAAAGLLGAAGTVSVGRSYGKRPVAAVALTFGAFVVATLFSVAGALLIGTRLGPGLLVVAASFGLCFAAAAFLHLLARA
jgi:hypothetical protein